MLGFISAARFIYGIKYLPLSEAVTLMYTSPVFTGLLAFILINEVFRRQDLIFALFSIAGIVMIARP